MQLIELVLMCALSLALAATPAHAQQTGRTYRIGALSDGPDPASGLLADAMRELGWVEGQNLGFERRSADTREQLSALAAELVRLKVDLIFTFGTLAESTEGPARALSSRQLRMRLRKRISRTPDFRSTVSKTSSPANMMLMSRFCSTHRRVHAEG